MKKYLWLLTPLLILVPWITVRAGLAEDLSGHILLQVERNGEAWYIYPEDNERYYLGRPNDAYSIMRYLGLGITDADLERVQNGEHKILDQVRGYILLQVEQHGEAYYVNPTDGSLTYLPDGDAAFDIMRSYGLGINDYDLGKISEGASDLNPETDQEETTQTEESEETTADFSPADTFNDNVTVTTASTSITVYSDGLPDHDTGEFPNSGNPNSISEQDIERTITLSPALANDTTFSGGMEFGIALNGILFEPLTGEYWDDDRNSGWNLEWSTNNLGFDFNNAHVQPDGTYHYHGEPTSLLAAVDGNTQTLIGYAADGFPIYVENLDTSYQVKSGQRPDGPGGEYDGTYVEDYEYVEGLGDLDECNGTTGTTPEYPDGTYYYVVTKSFPIISRCFSGTPDDSFVKGRDSMPPGRR